MIHESHYWKEDIVKRANLLRRRLHQVLWQDRTFAKVEQDLMLGFYSIRKLIESKKLSTSLVNASLSLVSHPCQRRVTQLNCNAIQDLYDMEKHTVEQRDIAFVCNQFIHSYVFMLTFSETPRLHGVLVSSDHERNRAVYHLSMDNILALFDLIVRDSPTIVRMTMNKHREDFDVETHQGPAGATMSLIMEDNDYDVANPDAVAIMIKSSLLRGLRTR